MLHLSTIFVDLEAEDLDEVILINWFIKIRKV